MIILQTASGHFANPFYPMLPAFRGTLLCVDAAALWRRMWLSALLTAVLASVATASHMSRDNYEILAGAVLVEQVFRMRLFPTQSVKTSDILSKTSDSRLSFDYLANLLCLGWSIAVVGMGMGSGEGGSWLFLASFLSAACVLMGLAPFLNLWAVRRNRLRN